MASVFGHGIVAFTLSRIFDKKNSVLLSFLAIGSAILPDADVLAFQFDIPYSHMLGHRGFTHSILFAVLWAFLMAIIFAKKRPFVFGLVIFMATISHGILDAMTTGGKGVGFFIPFTDARFFFPWRFIKVSPLGVGNFFSAWGIQVIYNEIIYIALPCTIVLLIYFILKKL